MKSPHWFSKSNSGRGFLRFAMAGGLLLTGVAMAFVAAIAPQHSSSKEDPIRAFPAKLSSQDLAGNGGEPGDVNRAAQESFRHRAYPAAVISSYDTLNAQNAWSKIKGKSVNAGANSQGQWSLIGPAPPRSPPALPLPATHSLHSAGRT